MKRRHFLQTLTAASAGAAMPALTGCISKTGKSGDTAELLPAMPEYSILQIRELYRKREVTPVQMVNMYLARIRAIDYAGPSLKSVVEVNPDAEEIARLLDTEMLQGKNRGPLHGIPVLIKDNIDTADRMHTTAGSLALKDSIAPKDAFIIKKLRNAGAIVLGKTNLSEWANFRSSRSTSGWSSRGGQTRNPYILDRNPCGSSSGSAVAVTANLCTVAIGTETDGSIVCPSSVNGIVGLKPTVGLWSRNGIIPISRTQDTAGPMARSVTDAAIVLGTLTGNDPEDPFTANSPFEAGMDFSQYLDIDGMKGARIGIARDCSGFHPEVDKLLEQAITAMKEMGALLVDPANFEIPAESGDLEMEVLLFEFKDGLNRYLSGLPGNVSPKTLEDLIAFNESHGNEEMPWFGQEIFHAAQKKKGLDDPQYIKTLSRLRSMVREKGVDRIIRKHQLDAIVLPTGAPAWTTDLVNGDHYIGGNSSPAACAGYPAITVPAGFVHGLPVGITFMGKAWSEPQLIKLAFAFEEHMKKRSSPHFLPTLPEN
jgi:amidase